MSEVCDVSTHCMQWCMVPAHHQRMPRMPRMPHATAPPVRRVLAVLAVRTMTHALTHAYLLFSCPPILLPRRRTACNGFPSRL